MPSTYSPDLRIELIATGEQSGTWGTTTNINLGTLIEDAVSGLASVSIVSADQALTAVNGAADQARCAAVNLTTSTGAPFNVYVPPVSKLYVIINSSGQTATVYCSTVLGNTTAAGTGVAIPTGKSVLLRADGTNVVEQLNHITGNLSIGGTASATAFSGPLAGNVTGNVTGNLTGNVAAGAGTIATTNFTFTEVGGVLYLKNGVTNILKVDASGNLTALANVAGHGTI
jgi:hypothetical protein